MKTSADERVSRLWVYFSGVSLLLFFRKLIFAFLFSVDCEIMTFLGTRHCVKSVQIRSYFWSVFSCLRTEYGDLRIHSNTGKYGPEITPYLDTFKQ